jgi:hypothetical protein
MCFPFLVRQPQKRWFLFRFFNSIPKKNPYIGVHSMDIGTVKKDVIQLYVTEQPVTMIDIQE